MNRIFFGLTTNLQEFVKNNVRLNSQLHESSSNKKNIKKRMKRTSKLNDSQLSLQTDLSSDITGYDALSDFTGRSDNFYEKKKKEDKDKERKNRKKNKDKEKSDKEEKKEDLKKEVITEISNDINLLTDLNQVAIINPNIEKKDITFDDLVEYVNNENKKEKSKDMIEEDNDDIQDYIDKLDSVNLKISYILSKMVFSDNKYFKDLFINKFFVIGLDLVLKLYKNKVKFFIFSKDKIKLKYDTLAEIGYNLKLNEFFIREDLFSYNSDYAYYLFALAYDRLMGHKFFSSKKAPVIINSFKQIKNGKNYAFDSLSNFNIVHFFATSIMAYFSNNDNNRKYHWERFKEDLIEFNYDIYNYLNYLFERAKKNRG